MGSEYTEYGPEALALKMLRDRVQELEIERDWHTKQNDTLAEVLSKLSEAYLLLAKG